MLRICIYNNNSSTFFIIINTYVCISAFKVYTYDSFCNRRVKMVYNIVYLYTYRLR